MNELLSALRSAGLTIGVADELRLREVLAAALPELEAEDRVPDPDALRALVRAVLVKSSESKLLVDHVFSSWLADREARFAPRDVPPVPRPTAPPAQLRWTQRLGRYRLLLLALYALLLAVPPLSPPPPPRPPLSSFAVSPCDGPPRAPGPPLVYPRPEHYQALTASLQIIAAPPPRFPLARALLFLAAALVSLGLAELHRRHRLMHLPKPAPPARDPGLARVQPQVALPAQILLSAQQEEALIYGIGRFVAAEVTRRVDVPATVSATTRAGGAPRLHFQRARHPREIWLWLDEAMTDTAWEEATRLTEEIEAALRRAGLRVERCHFVELPERLSTPDGPVAPADLEDRRDEAIVAILCDGRWLRQRLNSAHRRDTLALLRTLSGWPRLCVVDLSRGADGGLEELYAYGVLVLWPEQLAAFLATGVEPSARRREREAPGTTAATMATLTGDLRAWAAACALARAEVTAAQALRLREALGLALPPMALRRLRRLAGGGAGSLLFDRAQRLWLRRWLVTTDPGLLDRAVRWHQQVLAQEDQRRLALERTDLTEHWQQTLGRRHLQMEAGLLRLYRDPQAARGLYALYQGDLAAAGQPGDLARALRDELALLAPRECAGWAAAARRVVLPWEIGEQPAAVQHMLGRMGFAHGLLRTGQGLRRSGRAWLALGLCAGLTLAAGHSALRLRPPPSTAAPRVEEELLAAEQVKRGRLRYRTDALGGDRYRVLAWTAQRTWSLDLPAGTTVRLSAQVERSPCRVPLVGAERWSCGDVDPDQLPPWGRQSLVAVVADAEDGTAAELSMRLLDSGSAGVVLVGPQALTHLKAELAQQSPLGEARQALVVTTAAGRAEAEAALAGQTNAAVVVTTDRVALADLLHFPQTEDLLGKLLAQPLYGAAAGHSTGRQGDVALRGRCPRLEGQAGGTTLVRVCGGVFQMGAEEKDENAGEDEKPSHRVRVSEFWLSKTEVSNRTYLQMKRDHQGRFTKQADYPVESVSWEEARAYCRGQGMDLPTEAEWEYAARGVDGRRYPWGNEPLTHQRAVYTEDWKPEDYEKYHPEPIGSHPQGEGPFGALDQAGNIWEWTTDCYQEDLYRKRQSDKVVNPVVVNCQSCPTVLLRGGSFDYEPWNLRSSVRFRSVPADRYGSIGFRCVRGSRRSLVPSSP